MNTVYKYIIYAFHSRSTNLILTGLSGTANNFWYGSIRGDTLNGILQATAGEKIIEFKKKGFETIVISANRN